MSNINIERLKREIEKEKEKNAKKEIEKHQKLIQQNYELQMKKLLNNNQMNNNKLNNNYDNQMKKILSDNKDSFKKYGTANFAGCLTLICLILIMITIIIMVCVNNNHINEKDKKYLIGIGCFGGILIPIFISLSIYIFKTL